MAVMQLVLDLGQAQVVLEVEQFVHPHQEGKTPLFDLGEILLRDRESRWRSSSPGKNLRHPGETQLLPDPPAK